MTYVCLPLGAMAQLKSGLELALQELDHPVSLRVVGRGPEVGCAGHIVERSKKDRFKLTTLVCCDSEGRTEPGYPSCHKNGCEICRRPVVGRLNRCEGVQT